MLTLGLAAVPLQAADREDHFESRIRPLLSRHCIGCHGPEKQEGGLRLDDKAGWSKGGDSGTAILPGKPNESLLIQAVRRSGPVAAMPPKNPLTSAEVRDLEQWVRDGAIDTRGGSGRLGGMSLAEARSWWSFQPLAPSLPPATTDHPIDAFLKARMSPLGLKFQPLADKHDLLRRLSYDLTGLPPSPKMMQAYLNDNSAGAYEKIVDQLLASTEYGEKWGRHWLDLVRYADTAGENSDHPVVNAWRYRNWVINAFNQDIPYDRFIRAQLAGDLLAQAAPENEKADLIIATGYLAVARRFGHDTDSDMHLTFEDTIDTLGKTFLGLTLGCARCHDHKYDPVTTQDYYSLYGIFQSTRFPFPGCEAKMQPRDMVPLPANAAQKALTNQIDGALAEIDSEMSKLDYPDLDFAAGRILTTGTVREGGSSPLILQSPVELSKGDMLLLSITPIANQGADFTRVDLRLKGTDDSSFSRDLNSEAVDKLTSGNPIPGTGGMAANWYFFDLQKQPRLLWTPVTDAYGKKGLFAWRTDSETPAVMVNTSNDPVQAFTKLPSRTFFAHPGASGPVGIGFLSPMNVRVQITGHLSDAHLGGPDGVGFTLTHVPATSLQTLGRHVEIQTRVKQLSSQRAALVSKRPIPEMAYAVAEAKPGDAAVQIRGEPGKKGPIIPRGMPAILGGTPVSMKTASGRMELANWLASPSNPLVARVMVNRIWQQHFGAGLVRSPNDFGSRGLKPTHPELLDWLAHGFMKNGYSMKRVHKLIVTSHAYRQSAGPPNSLDPDNQWLARFSRRRLSAEEIRDSLLLAAGNLDASPGGAHPFPPEKSWGFTQHNPFAAQYDTNKRAVYQMITRNRRHPFFALFDGADPNSSTPERQATTVPTQALFFMNDPLVHESAKALATRGADKPTAQAQIDALFMIALQRPSSPREFESLMALAPPGSTRLSTGELASVARVVVSGNSFLTVD